MTSWVVDRVHREALPTSRCAVACENPDGAAPGTESLARARGLTTAELAELGEVPTDYLDRLLGEDEARGIVERVEGRWRLTTDAELKFGWALRHLKISDFEGGTP